MSNQEFNLSQLNVIIERFGIFYLYDGQEISSFNDHKDLKRFIFQEDITYLATLDLALQDIDLDNCMDALELLVFTHPTCKVAPSVKSIAKFLELKNPATPEDEVIIIRKIIQTLLKQIDTKNETLVQVFTYMSLKGWNWGGFLNHLFNVDLGKLDKQYIQEQKYLATHKNLDKWKYNFFNDEYDLIKTITPDQAQKTLEKIIEKKGGSVREQQVEYTRFLAENFDVDITTEQTNISLLQAPTGIGKTFGYLAPSLVFAKQNNIPVWISTFTKNLQAQVQESLAEFDDVKVALRKGRQNYLCLLKAQQLFDKEKSYFNGFIALWIEKTKDGDIVSGDFPQWIFNMHNKRPAEYVDTDNSCIYSACPHFKKCFIEKSIQAANVADIVVSNHALTTIEGVVNFTEPSKLPPVVIFDESHDLFHAVDDAFSSFLSATQLKDFTDFLGLRNKKGLLQRMAEILQYLPSDENISDNMNNIVQLGEHMPYNDWFMRLSKEDKVLEAPMENPDAVQVKSDKNISQNFFNLLYRTLLAQNADSQYVNMQSDVKFLFEGEDKKDKSLELIPQAKAMLELLADIQKNLNIMVDRIDILIERYCLDSDDMDALRHERKLRGLQNSIKVKMQYTLDHWLEALKMQEKQYFTTYLEMNMSVEGKVYDVGVKRHYTNPMVPFANKVLSHVQSVNFTSATMNDIPIKKDEDWKTALKLTGTQYVKNKKLSLHQAQSPFDYKKQAKVLIVDDVDYHNKAELARAFSALFLANKGHALGLFTAISRLSSTYNYLKKKLKEKSINLYAQHMQNLDVSTLVDIFKEDTSSCLIGTDALKQGVDVPGESLTLVVCDKLPRPVPTILMNAREESFGKGYRNLVTRMSLKQAFGRLIRRVDDNGIFVLLDPRINRSELKAFPEDVEIATVSLAEAIKIIEQSKEK